MRIGSDTYVDEPARSTPVYGTCDVLVVGGGPAGTAAAVAAGRLGADVVLLERYNHLGGLSTGGLVIWIDRMTDWEGKLVIRGFAEELFDRLPADAVAGPSRAEWGSRDAGKASYWSNRTAAYHGVVTWSPTITPSPSMKVPDTSVTRPANPRATTRDSSWAGSRRNMSLSYRVGSTNTSAGSSAAEQS